MREPTIGARDLRRGASEHDDEQEEAGGGRGGRHRDGGWVGMGRRRSGEERVGVASGTLGTAWRGG